MTVYVYDYFFLDSLKELSTFCHSLISLDNQRWYFTTSFNYLISPRCIYSREPS